MDAEHCGCAVLCGTQRNKYQNNGNRYSRPNNGPNTMMNADGLPSNRLLCMQDDPSQFIDLKLENSQRIEYSARYINVLERMSAPESVSAKNAT